VNDDDKTATLVDWNDIQESLILAARAEDVPDEVIDKIILTIADAIDNNS
jgi:hypothetical protein